MGLLSNMINHHNRNKHRNDTRVMRDKLHPSTIGMCERRIVFDMLMVPKDEPSDQLLEIFQNGHAMHERYQKTFADMGILLADEMPIKRGSITGSVDAKVKIYTFQNPNGEERLIELKSAAAYSFKWMVEKNLPKVEHKAQLQFYMHLSGIPKGTLYVENKDTQEKWEYDMDYDPVYGSKLEAKANKCISMNAERKLPEIPKGFTPSCYKCSLCDYNFYCHNDSITKGKQRYPVPFPFGSEAYFDSQNIIQAVNNKSVIPDVIDGVTNGDLARCVLAKTIR